MGSHTCARCAVGFSAPPSAKRQYCSKKCRYPSLPDRFWAKVSVAGPEECWEWTGTRTGKGYGKLTWGNGRNVFAHRASLILHVRPAPPGLWVLHHCDNPPCVNPSHLYTGTVRDNAKDMVRRGRSGLAKITAANARHIRVMARDGAPPGRLARMFGVAEVTVGSIVRGKSWDVPEAMPKPEDEWAK